MKIELVHADGHVLGTLEDTPTGLTYGGAHPHEVERIARSVAHPALPEDHPQGASGFVRWLARQLQPNGYGYAAFEVPPDDRAGGGEIHA